MPEEIEYSWIDLSWNKPSSYQNVVDYVLIKDSGKHNLVQEKKERKTKIHKAPVIGRYKPRLHINFTLPFVNSP